MTEQDVELDLISETENFAVWRSEEEEEGFIYHLELGAITLHLTSEEWEELTLLLRDTD